MTRDGVRIVVRANLELAEEIPALDRHHAEGVGLFRSEFLYLRAAEPPGVEEQRAVYEELLEAAAPHPVGVRTYDLGGEQGIGPGGGENPALGLRGIRYCLAHPEILDAQLSALCLASRKGPLSILLPWVGSRGERAAAGAARGGAARRAGVAPPPLGIMIEIPSTALLCHRFATETDFFSIGTNDLAQYALAVDRANPDVASLYQPLHPAILRMLGSVVEAGRSSGRPVAVCGELASDPVGIAVLVGLGIRELSVTPVAIAGVKDALSTVDSVRAGALVERAMGAAEAAEVEKIFRGRT
jgi:phosphoenolpyruvate-protein kinase (PTS system EI component)